MPKQTDDGRSSSLVSAVLKTSLKTRWAKSGGEETGLVGGDDAPWRRRPSSIMKRHRY